MHLTGQGLVLCAAEPCEATGFYPNAVFSCGAFIRDGAVHMYYGADCVMVLARAELNALLDSLEILA